MIEATGWAVLRRLRPVVGLVVGALALWVIVRAAGGFSSAESAFRSASVPWITVAFVAEAVSYVLIGLHLRCVAVGAHTLTSFDAVELGLVVWGFGLLTPASPVEGLVIAGSEMRHRGMSRQDVTMTFVLREWFSALTAPVIILVCVLVALARGSINGDETVVLACGSIVVLAVIIGVVALSTRVQATERIAQLLGLIRWRRARPSAETRRAQGAAWHAAFVSTVGSPRRRGYLLAVAAAYSLTDTMCLWFSLIATDVHVGLDIVVLAAGVGMVATWIPLVPAGIGVVEAVVPAVLHHFGAPLDAALAGTLLYRCLGTFVPAAAGALAMLHLKARRSIPVVSRSGTV